MRIVVVAICLIASVAFASNANAGIYGDVPDEWIAGFDKSDCGSMTLSQCEEAELADALNVSTDDVSLTKINTTSSDWIQVSSTLVAFDFSSYGANPLAYIVKIGNSLYDFNIFLNSDNNQYALIDLSKIPTDGSKTITITSLSHISTVPEAGSLSLLLSGLAALGLVSVRRQRLIR
jgi:PEP-CTERM motif-containing protein